ncbi:MAG: hypothetical protein RIM84_15265 [Alphaproteobacteria bacterium]
MALELVDAALGRIDRLFLTNLAFAAGHFTDALRSVIAALPAQADVDALVFPCASDRVGPWFDRHGAPVRLHPAPDDLNYSHWAQDVAVAAVTPDDSPRLFAASRFARYQDREAARLLADATGIPLTEVDWPAATGPRRRRPLRRSRGGAGGRRRRGDPQSTAPDLDRRTGGEAPHLAAPSGQQRSGGGRRAGPGRRTVWLPSFAHGHRAELAPVERANTAIWRGLGFDVHTVANLLEFAENRGALNCMCKVVARRAT